MSRVGERRCYCCYGCVTPVCSGVTCNHPTLSCSTHALRAQEIVAVVVSWINYIGIRMLVVEFRIDHVYWCCWVLSEIYKLIDIVMYYDSYNSGSVAHHGMLYREWAGLIFWYIKDTYSRYIHTLDIDLLTPMVSYSTTGRFKNCAVAAAVNFWMIVWLHGI